MNREEILEEAKKIVTSDRNQQYGEPEDNFEVIAKLWTAYFSRYISSKDVAMAMVLFKIGRAMTCKEEKTDTYIDICGYAACAGQISTNKEDFYDFTRKSNCLRV